MDTFKDKVVLITGASSGIGACTAIEYAKRGAKLALTGRNEARLNGAREKCIEVGADPENVLLVLADLAVEAECLNFVEKAEEYFGRIDVLVNNAGHMLGGNIDKCSVEDMDLMYTVNVRSMFIITKRAIPHLEKSKGSIVNISSLAGDRPIHYAFAYAISKAAVTQFTKTLAQDLAARQIRVNCVSPGVVESDLFVRDGGLCDGRPEILSEVHIVFVMCPRKMSFMSQRNMDFEIPSYLKRWDEADSNYVKLQHI